METEGKKVTANHDTAAERIRLALEEEILSGTLAPGERLDEQALARRFGASRTPVREALRHLASSRLVELKPRQGAVVMALSIPELIEIFEVMAELEGLCARLAARRSSPEERDALRVAHEACRERMQSNDPESFYRENRRFHEIIYSATHNGYLRETTRALRSRVGPYRRYVTYQPGRMAKSVVEHEKVLQAILAGDAASAQNLMREHVNLLGDGFADFVSILQQSEIRRAAGGE